MKKIFIFLVLLSNLIIGQTSEIYGTIKDKDFQDVLPFANILVRETMEGTTSDFDGLYRLELAPGSYTVEFSFIGYETIVVTDVILEEDQSVEVSTSLSIASQQMNEVIVSSSVLKNTEQNILSVQKRSANLLDGISSQNFRKIGASDLAKAVKNVPGVSVQGGKYVYVRGLGDRYTKSIINGVDIPGLDPDRNTIQFDIFPTSAIDQVIVLKSSSAELPADFTGGIVDIITKDIPSEKILSLSVSTEFNPNMHFNNSFLEAQKSNSDWLGFDGGLRDIPFDINRRIPLAVENNSKLYNISSSFNPILKAKQSKSLIDYNVNLSFGNQFNLFGKSIGYITAFSYSKDFRHYDDFISNYYLKNSDKSINKLRLSESLNGVLSQENVLLSGLAGISLKGEKSKYKFQILHLQNGVTASGLYNTGSYIYSSNTQIKDVLDYNEKSVTNILISGKHYFFDGTLTADWKISPTKNSKQDKDIRYTPFRLEEGEYSIEPSETGDPARIWRNLEERSWVNKLDFIFDYSLMKRKAKMKFGGFYSYKDRGFGINTFFIKFRGRVADIATGNANLILAPYNLWNTDDFLGSYILNGSGPASIYSSDQEVSAFYFSNEFNMSKSLRLVLGIRYENYIQEFTGIDQNDISLRDEAIIDTSDLYPSLNLIYSINENTNIRGSYSKTIARPSFKEASNATIFDPINNIVFLGNLNLKPSYIQNFDIRYEKFGGPGELFAVSAFYKKFKDPIEIVTYSVSANDNFQPRNVGSAQVYGLEFEFRKKISEVFNLRFNSSLIEARQKLDKSSGGEFESRQTNLREGETMNDYRDLQGQSPYLINFGLDYTKDDISSGIYFNTQGKTLQVVGIGFSPDIYTMPFNSLNFTFEKKIGSSKNQTFRIRVKNILNNTQRSEFISYQAGSNYFQNKLSIGRSLSIGYGINL